MKGTQARPLAAPFAEIPNDGAAFDAGNEH